jgi:hypothetical protein
MKTSPRLAQVEALARIGWELFPLNADKKPMTVHGFYDATTSIEQLRKWYEETPGANWGARMGSGKVAVDVDPRNEGDVTWDALRTEHPEPLETVEQKTGGGGRHYIFSVAAPLACRQDALGPGVDIKGDGGYIVVPPSVTTGPYEWIRAPWEAPLQEIPGWVVDLLSEKPEAKSVVGVGADEAKAALGDKIGRAFKALSMLNPERADNYDGWTRVGMCLRELGPLGLTLWDEWSKKSAKFQPGACAHKWETFSTDEGDLTLATLFFMAEQDAGEVVVPDAPKGPRPSDYMAALAALNFTFTLNTMSNDVHVNGARQEDVIRAVLFTELAQRRYVNRAIAENAWIAEASKHAFHPVRDYLNSLTWDGEPNIGLLCGFVDHGANVRFNTFLRRWLIGAVARPFAGPIGCQSRAFVIDGKQGIGKSRFVRFLGSPLPQFFMESGIVTEDKDFLLYLCSTWIWEVAELGSTLRKADRDALKHFLSRQTVRVRRAYGHEYTDKPAVASFIPTINNEAGFLWDPTGYRRFMVATVERFDWRYESEVDINQVWAEAAAAYKSGEAWELKGEEAAEAEAACQHYEIDDPLVDAILKRYEVDQDKGRRRAADSFVPTSTILQRLKDDSAIREAGRREAMQVGGILLKLGCTRGDVRRGGYQQKGYFGLRGLP